MPSTGSTGGTSTIPDKKNGKEGTRNHWPTNKDSIQSLKDQPEKIYIVLGEIAIKNMAE